MDIGRSEKLERLTKAGFPVEALNDRLIDANMPVFNLCDQICYIVQDIPTSYSYVQRR